MSSFILSAFADEIDSSLKTQMDVLEPVWYQIYRNEGGQR